MSEARAARPVKQRVWRILRHLQRFRYATFDVANIGDGEEALGIYTNPDDYWVTPEIRVSNQALYFEAYDDAVRVAYPDILRVGPTSKAAVPLKLHLADGGSVDLPVMGTRDKTVDALEMLRFLTRVLSDLGRPNWPGTSEPMPPLAGEMSVALADFDRTGRDLKDPHYADDKLWEWLMDIEPVRRADAERVLIQWVLSRDHTERWVALNFSSRLSLRSALPNLTVLANHLEQLPGPAANYEALRVRRVQSEIERSSQK